MQILVTGGCGYIGSHTVIELLMRNNTTIIIDNLSNSSIDAIEKIKMITSKTPIFYHGDVGDTNLLEMIFTNYNIDVVIHFAGCKSVNESIANPLMYYQNNLLTTLNLIKIMEKNKIYNIIFSSSATVYGSSISPVSESNATGLNITNPYGKTKYIIEEFLKDLYFSNKKWTIFILRYFNPVGSHKSGIICENPKNIPNNLMPVIMKCAINNEKLSIYGSDYDTVDGTCVRDFIHVVDLANGHCSCLELLNKNEIYIINLGTGIGTTIKHLIESFATANNIQINYKYVDRRHGDVAISFANNDYARKILKWTPIYGINDMCIDSWKSYVNKINNI